MLPLSAAAESWELTLDESVKRGLEENRDIAVARERLVELDGIKGEALAGGLPQFTAASSFQRQWRRPQIIINGLPFTMGTANTYQASVGVTQMLWDGGRVIKAVKAAKTEKARGIENVRDAEDQIRLQVKQTFYQILYVEKVIDVLDRQLKQLHMHLDSIRARFEKGIDSDYVLMRQEVEVSNVEPQLLEAKRNRELLLNGMKVILAIPQQDEFVPIGSFDYHTKVLPNVETLIESARAKRPDLSAEKLRAKSLEQMIGMERAGYWPTLNFSSTFQWQGQSNQWTVNPEQKTDYLQSIVSLSWPIFDGLKTYSRVKQAKAKLYEQRSMTSQMEDAVVKEVKDLYETLVRARESLNTQEKSLNLARKATAIAGKRFEAGLMSQIELNDTINAQARAEQFFLQAAIDCLTAEAALEKSAGGQL